MQVSYVQQTSFTLIDARTDTQVWADRYDGELADVFTIQSEIAQKIAAQLKAALSPNEQAALGARPTRDTAAYELYLRARQLHRDGGAGGTMGRNALAEVGLLDEAVARDPGFVAALCLLVQAHLMAYSYSEEHTPERLELARKALEAAARFEPDSGEVHFSRALFHFLGYGANSPALTELALAASRLPNDASILFYMAVIQRRQGRWDESIRGMERALILDPRNGTYTLNLSWNYRFLRRYQDAARVVDNLLAWKPEDLGFQLIRAEIDLEEKADLTRMRAILSHDLPADTDQNIVQTYRLMLAYCQRDYSAAATVLAGYAIWDTTHGFSTPRAYLEGLVARGLGKTEPAGAAFLRARELAAASVTKRPDDAKALIVLAKIDAKLGRKDEAISEAEHAVELLPISMDTYDGPLMLVRLAQVYAEVQETDRAIAVLQEAATIPAGPAYGNLQLDLEFDPLRNDPRFQ